MQLTTRELECLFYVLKGKTSKHIGKTLNISYRTVETHMSNVKSKLNIRNKSELIEKAIESGYIQIYLLPEQCQ